MARPYEWLTHGDPVQPVDLIFVMAGRMDRKEYALELYRQGVAPRLLLSVGRFEVSKMPRLGIPGVEELIALRSKTPEQQRHFFVSVVRSGTKVDRAPLSLWNTYGEILGLRQYLAGEAARKVMIVSTGIHLRRVSYTIQKVFRDGAYEFHYSPVPECGTLTPANWWVRPDTRAYVLTELIKLAGYFWILSLPPRWAAQLMRLRRFLPTR